MRGCACGLGRPAAPRGTSEESLPTLPEPPSLFSPETHLRISTNPSPWFQETDSFQGFFRLNTGQLTRRSRDIDWKRLRGRNVKAETVYRDY